MARKKSLTSQLYSLARASTTSVPQAVGRGAYAARVVRRETCGKTMGATRRFLRGIGLSE